MLEFMCQHYTAGCGLGNRPIYDSDLVYSEGKLFFSQCSFHVLKSLKKLAGCRQSRKVYSRLLFQWNSIIILYRRTIEVLVL